MREELQGRAHEAVALALGLGASGARAHASRSRALETVVRDGVLEKAQESTSRSLSLRVWIGRRCSGHSTNDLRPEALRPFVEEAVAITKALEEDPFQDLPDPALYQGRPEVDLELADGTVMDNAAAAREAWGIAASEAAHADPRVISASTFVSQSHDIGALVASNGLSGHWEGTSLWGGAEVTVRDEGDARPEAGFYGGGTHKDRLPDAAAAGREALARALERLGTGKGPTLKTTMIVDPRVSAQIVRRLLGAANAGSISQGRSFYAGKLGQRMFAPSFTLLDDPLVRRGDGSRTFDSEGIAARPLPIVEEGVLRNVFVDTYYGRKAGLAPTTGSSSNLIVKPGTRSRDALVQAAPKAVLVTGWLGGNSDATTGDFSLGIRGHIVENGVVGPPVGEMNCTGNLVELFANLMEVGNDPWPYGSARVPTLVFDGVQFSGA